MVLFLPRLHLLRPLQACSRTRRRRPNYPSHARPFPPPPAAPITAANLLLNAQQGLYNGATLSVSGNAVLAGGQASGGGAAEAATLDAPPPTSGRRTAPADLPLEILAAGDFEPVYRSPLDVRNGELPVLPLSIYGAGACGGAELAREPSLELPSPRCFSAVPVLPSERLAAVLANGSNRLPSPCAPAPPLRSGHVQPTRQRRQRLRERHLLLHLQVRPPAGAQACMRHA